MMLLFATIVRRTQQAWAGLFCAGLYAFSPVFWTYAGHNPNETLIRLIYRTRILHIFHRPCLVGQGEVFALNNLMTCLLLYIAVVFFETPTLNLGLLGAFVCGLGLTNQHTLILFELPLVLCVLWAGRSFLLTLSGVVKLLIVFALGFSVYLYLPIVGYNVPVVSWGDSTTWESFLVHLLRVEYGSFRLSADHTQGVGIDRMWAGLTHWASAFLWEESGGFGHLAIIGVIVVVIEKYFLQSAISQSAKAGRMESHTHPSDFPMLAMFTFYLLVFHYLANLPLHGIADHISTICRFWMQPNLIAFLYLGVALTAILDFLRKKLFSLPTSALVALAIGVISWQCQRNWEECDQSENYIIREFGKSMLDPMPIGALLIGMGDHGTNSIRYMQAAEAYRLDVVVMDQNLMSTEWFQKMHAKKHFPAVIFPGRRYWPERTYCKKTHFLSKLLFV